MKTSSSIATGVNFTAVDFGKWSELNEYTLPIAPGVELAGKVFGGQALGVTGSDFSLQTFAPGQEVGFYHSHKNHEESYFFISGEGEFQVDGQNFPIQEGSVVRVSPEGKRTLRNTGKDPLVMICLQYQQNTFDAKDAEDANMLMSEPVIW